MEALNSKTQNKLLEEESDEDEDNPFPDKDGSSDSESSDPLGMLADEEEDPDVSNTDGVGNSTRDRRASSKQRASVRTAKFSKLNVLASIEGLDCSLPHLPSLPFPR